MEIDLDRFLHALQVVRLKNRIRYKLGAKPGLTTPLEDITQSDCSGFIRRLFYEGGVLLPMGSVLQREQIEAWGWPRVTYSGEGGDLVISFINPSLGRPGHVWCVYRGFTIECYPKGIMPRKWNDPAFKRVYRSFKVPVKSIKPAR
jgi:hypothetical protein